MFSLSAGLCSLPGTAVAITASSVEVGSCVAASHGPKGLTIAAISGSSCVSHF